MSKTLFSFLGIFLLIVIAHYSNEYFEDKIYGQNKKVLGASKEERFFLPFPKDYQLISTSSDQRNSNIIIVSTKPSSELKAFYKEILRSKDYQNDYEFEKDNIIEIRYLKEDEDLKITFTQEGKTSIVEFNYHK